MSYQYMQMFACYYSLNESVLYMRHVQPKPIQSMLMGEGIAAVRKKSQQSFRQEYQGC